MAGKRSPRGSCAADGRVPTAKDSMSSPSVTRMQVREPCTPPREAPARTHKRYCDCSFSPFPYRLKRFVPCTVAWRDLQLRRAYCDGPLNFDRRDRAEVLAREKGVALAEVALGYVVSQSPRSFALVGTTSASHFKQDAATAKLDSQVTCLSRAELEYLESGTARDGCRAAQWKPSWQVRNEVSSTDPSSKKS